MEELRNQDGCVFFCILLCIYLVPAWVCNVSAGTDPPKCSLSLPSNKIDSHASFSFSPNCFQSWCVDYFSLGKVSCGACSLSYDIHIWNSWATFSLRPVCQLCAPELVVRESAENGCQPARWCLVWWSGGGVLNHQPRLVFAAQRCQLFCLLVITSKHRLHVSPFTMLMVMLTAQTVQEFNVAQMC